MLTLFQIKVLLTAVKDFNPDSGDSTYTMGIIDLLLECVQVSYRPGQYPLQCFLMHIILVCFELINLMSVSVISCLNVDF